MRCMLVFYGFHVLLSLHSYSDVFKYLKDIFPVKNTSAFGYFNVQEYDNTKYFIV